MPAPARRALDPPSGRFWPNCRAHASSSRWPAPETRKCSQERTPPRGIEDRRGQRQLVRVDPDHVARVIGRDQYARRSRTALLAGWHLPSRPSPAGMFVDRTGPQHPGGHPPSGANAPIRSGRSSKGTNRGRHFRERTPTRGSDLRWVRPRFIFSTLTRAVARAGIRNSTPGSEILNAVAREGWEIVTASFVFREQGQQSRDKFMSSGQNVATKGTTVGYYLFRRAPARGAEAAAA